MLLKKVLVVEELRLNELKKILQKKLESQQLIKQPLTIKTYIISKKTYCNILQINCKLCCSMETVLTNAFNSVYIIFNYRYKFKTKLFEFSPEKFLIMMENSC